MFIFLNKLFVVSDAKIERFFTTCIKNNLISAEFVTTTTRICDRWVEHPENLSQTR